MCQTHRFQEIKCPVYLDRSPGTAPPPVETPEDFIGAKGTVTVEQQLQNCPPIFGQPLIATLADCFRMRQGVRDTGLMIVRGGWESRFSGHSNRHVGKIDPSNLYVIL